MIPKFVGPPGSNGLFVNPPSHFNVKTKASDNGGVDDWKGTLGNTVLGPGTVSFTFLANQVYSLGLKSVIFLNLSKNLN